MTLNDIGETLCYFNSLDITKYQKFSLVLKHWPSLNENLWFGKIDFSHFHNDSSQIRCLITDLLKDYKAVPNLDDPSNPANQISKICYLLPEYLKSKSFRDPFCAHYNPRINEHIIHPGGTRQSILNLFHKGPIETYYFNTGGNYFEFLHGCQQVNVFEFFEQSLEEPSEALMLGKGQANYVMDIIPDHGTFIPHILNSSGVSALSTKQEEAYNNYSTKLSDPNYKCGLIIS